MKERTIVPTYTRKYDYNIAATVSTLHPTYLHIYSHNFMQQIKNQDNIMKELSSTEFRHGLLQLNH